MFGAKEKMPAAAVPASAEKSPAAAVSAAAKKKKPLAAAAASAAAKEKKPSAAAVSAAAKKKKPPAAAAVSAAAEEKKPSAAAPACAEKDPAAAPKKRASGGTVGRRPQELARDGSCDADLLSNLPDDILRTIVSLLPTKDGARTQAIARKWRPLWRYAPLNINAGDLCPGTPWQTVKSISNIISDHPGPIRCLDCRIVFLGDSRITAQMASWLESPSLDNLQKLHILFPLFTLENKAGKRYRLPPSMLRFASTIVVATIGHCDFPNELAPTVNFPLLKHLTLWRISISNDVFHGVLSACNVLETLFLDQHSFGSASLHISSSTLRSIGFRRCYMGKEELVIENTPQLQRLLCLGLHCESIRINGATKLEILGPLSPHNSSIQIGDLVIQGLIPTSLNHSICTVKVLALKFSCTELDAVLDILRLFPCLEKLYVMWNQDLWNRNLMMKNVRRYDPLDPIKCLHTHLKKLVLKNYKGDEEDVRFAKFFVLNAKVLNEIKFGVNKKITKKWVADQHRLLGVETKASPHAQFEFVCGYDLSFADQFINLFADGVDAHSEEAGSWY